MYKSSGNGIIVRCHQTVKRIAAWKSCSIMEVITPRDDLSASSAPANLLHSCNIRVNVPPSGLMTSARYKDGDTVSVKNPYLRCASKFVIRSRHWEYRSTVDSRRRYSSGRGRCTSPVYCQRQMMVVTQYQGVMPRTKLQCKHQ